MRKQLLMFGLLSALALVLTVSPIDANFVQCPGGGAACASADGTTGESDIINGSPDIDEKIEGLGGGDLIFGNGSPDAVEGDDGNDLIFGGLDSDVIEGDDGDDMLLPGPDTFDFSQEADGDDGNDTFIVLVGEIASCLFIFGDRGHDVVNLIGFGPYSANSPFGIADYELGVILIVDPITGGRIFVEVGPDALDDTEVINGLPTPNPIFLTDAELFDLTNENGTDPCPDLFFAQD